MRDLTPEEFRAMAVRWLETCSLYNKVFGPRQDTFEMTVRHCLGLPEMTQEALDQACIDIFGYRVMQTVLCNNLLRIGALDVIPDDVLQDETPGTGPVYGRRPELRPPCLDLRGGTLTKDLVRERNNPLFTSLLLDETTAMAHDYSAKEWRERGLMPEIGDSVLVWKHVRHSDGVMYGNLGAPYVLGERYHRYCMAVPGPIGALQDWGDRSASHVCAISAEALYDCLPGKGVYVAARGVPVALYEATNFEHENPEEDDLSNVFAGMFRKITSCDLRLVDGIDALSLIGG